MREESRENQKRNFVSRFQEIVVAPMDPSSIYETGESITLVWKTEWAAISLVRRLTFPISLTVQVEIHMPVLSADNDSINYMAMPDDMVLHMDYLRGLLEAGFDLQVIGEECLWVASRDFKEVPPSELLDILMPPGPKARSS